ncbi:hypothetical protein [Caballeronia sp. SBC2]|uniref:hypothetical protein n=1 Tax=Caballeronia sp. SBC2 TaxID=2705547 RepID=UPI0013E1C443|nr:hypothetical protein [Caballeronia sp. SBC2]QIE30201.1 hypothetical protein SBC2_82770 [Caballeronia sp. SBC2]
MRIRFSIINPDILAQVCSEVDTLLDAVNAGDMERVDSATEKLLLLTGNCRSTDLSEEEWRVFLDGIRSKNPAFESSYILPGSVCATIFPAVTANDFVLELPIDGDAKEEDAGV